MPVPKTKTELLTQSTENYHKLQQLIASYSDNKQQQEFTGGTMNRNIRDVLVHLHVWHGMFLSWYEVGMQNGKPIMPAPGYTWKDTKALNRNIWETNQEISLAIVRKNLADTHQQLIAIITQHTDEELFTKKYYKWTGTSSLATYIRANTSSHYQWAYRLIRKGIKN